MRLAILLVITYISLASCGFTADSEREAAREYLSKYKPDIDKTLSEDYIETNIDLALKARSLFPYAKTVPFDIFLNDVLPYSVVDERRDPWRQLFFDKFSPIVKDAKTTAEAALLLNEKIWSNWNIVFKSDQTPQIMSPFQVIDAHHASCTGLSIFLVNACRSVGIPARMVGTPLWNTKTGGNHDWVEVLTDPSTSEWSFTGPTEYNGHYNQTWFFPSPAKSAIPGYEHGIFATSYGPTEAKTYFPMSWATSETWVPGEDVTTRYLYTSS